MMIVGMTVAKARSKRHNPKGETPASPAARSLEIVATRYGIPRMVASYAKGRMVTRDALN